MNKALVYQGQKVITTAMLAEAYGIDSANLRNNFKRNKNRFEEGKHYFHLTGEELKDFKRYVTDSYAVNPAAPAIYLWTERGANHHCKILDTDKAWEQFENLEETYFRVKEGAGAFPNPEAIKYLSSLANYLRVQRTIMKDKGCTPLEIALMSKLTCDTYGVPVPKCLTEPKPFEQLTINNTDAKLLTE